MKRLQQNCLGTFENLAKTLRENRQLECSLAEKMLGHKSNLRLKKIEAHCAVQLKAQKTQHVLLGFDQRLQFIVPVEYFVVYEMSRKRGRPTLQLRGYQ